MTEQPYSAEALPSDIQHLLASLDTDVALHLAARIKALIMQSVADETERCVQIALQYRDEVDAGEHAGLGDPERALGQGYAANLIGKRIRSAAERPAPAAVVDYTEQARELLLEWMRSRPGGTYQSSIQATEFKRLINIIAAALSAVASQHQTAAAVDYTSATAGGIIGCWEDKWEIDAGKIPEGALDDLELEVRRALSAVASQHQAVQAAEVEQAYRVGKTFGTVETRAALLARLHEPDVREAVAKAIYDIDPIGVRDWSSAPASTREDCFACADAAIARIVEILK